MKVHFVLISLLAALAACSVDPIKSTQATGCGAGLESMDAAACWLWSDAVARSSLPDKTPPRPLLRGTDGTVIVGGQPTQ